MMIPLIFSVLACYAVAHDVNMGKHDAHMNVDGQHDSSYDHEAFLGKEAGEFDQLPPEESKLRLKKYLPRIDKDNDTLITREELIEHIRKMAREYVETNVQSTWSVHPHKDGKLSWEDYRRSVTGVQDPKGDIADPVYAEMIRKDERRWKIADRDGDGLLSQEEFEILIHPEDHLEIARDLLITEGTEQFDKDKDGAVSWDEYISDIYNHEDEEDLKKGIEPEWMTAEKENFKQYKDKDGDMKLNHEEVGAWLYPQEYNHAEVEARHLLDMADDDKDGKLSFDEVLAHHEVFAGSQATAYGDSLKKLKHDPSEL